MLHLKILNGKEIKEIFEKIEEQWDAKIKLDYGFLLNTKNRVFIISREISKIDMSKLRLNSVGIYFCELDKRGLRLSIEGSQLVGPHAKKNVVELDDAETMKWFKGEDLQKECKDCEGFVLMKHDRDFMGTGKYANGKILNFVGKTRRISVS